MDLEIAVPDDVDCRKHARHYHKEQHQGHCPAGEVPALARFGADRRVAEVLDADERGQGYEHAVDEEQIRGPEDVGPVEYGDSVADRAERGHQRGGDGNPGEHGAALLPGVLEYAGKAAEQGHKYVIDSRIGPGEQFGGVLHIQRAEQEKDSGRQDADGHHNPEIP